MLLRIIVFKKTVFIMMNLNYIKDLWDISSRLIIQHKYKIIMRGHRSIIYSRIFRNLDIYLGRYPLILKGIIEHSHKINFILNLFLIINIKFIPKYPILKKFLKYKIIIRKEKNLICLLKRLKGTIQYKFTINIKRIRLKKKEEIEANKYKKMMK